MFRRCCVSVIGMAGAALGALQGSDVGPDVRGSPPLATNQLPPTTCHQPIVTNQLPPTNCHQPIVTNQISTNQLSPNTRLGFPRFASMRFGLSSLFSGPSVWFPFPPSPHTQCFSFFFSCLLRFHVRSSHSFLSFFLFVCLSVCLSVFLSFFLSFARTSVRPLAYT